MTSKVQSERLKTTVTSEVKEHFQYVRENFTSHIHDADLLREIIFEYLKDKPKPPPELEPRFLVDGLS